MINYAPYCFRFLRHKRGAFTFVEILLVICLLSMVGVAVYNTLSNGLKIWQRSYQSIEEEDIAIFFDKLNQDVRNIIQYSQIRFEGSESRLSFATIVYTPPDFKREPKPKGEYVEEVGKVTYHFDILENKLYRTQANYGQATNDKVTREQLLASNIRSLKFGYYYPTQQGYILQGQGRDIIPSSIKIDIELMGDRNTKNMARLISIPLGS